MSAYPAEVTPQMVANFVAGGAAINVLAAEVGASSIVVDVGVAGPIPAADRDTARGGRLVSARIRTGTADMTDRAGDDPRRGDPRDRGRARPRRRELRDGGLELLGIGEMGIGNTTAASALTAALTGAAVETVTGRGTGVDDDGNGDTRSRSSSARSRSTAPIRPTRSACSPRSAGSRSAALVGVILGGVAARIPVVLDGFITGSAALVAVALAPAVAPRLIAGHRSPSRATRSSWITSDWSPSSRLTCASGRGPARPSRWA